MANNGAQVAVLLGHSTGGLTALHYAMTYPSRASGLVLNSPFLDFNTQGLERSVLLPLASWAGSFLPLVLSPSRLPSHYGESLHKSMKGEWDFDLSVKPVPTFTPTLGFIRTVKRAQHQIRKWSFAERILLLHSSCSYHGAVWSEQVFTCDAILDVNSMRAIGPRLGSRVEMAEIEGAVHDVFLSRQPVREQALHRMVDFLKSF
jgi:alpha-beta hydrolase superfamily lysophospholipase